MEKHTLAVTLLALLAQAAVAAEPSPRLSFTGYTNKNPLLYSCGEEMRFAVTLVDEARQCAPVKGYRLVWTRRGDDGVTEQGEASSDAPLLVRTKSDKPGFVRLTVNVLDAGGKKVRNEAAKRDVVWDGGAGADVNRIEAWPIPADFDAFWDRQVAALGKHPCRATLTELASRSDKVYFAKFLIPMPGEAMPAQGLVAWPKEAKPGSLPLDVEVTGYGFHATHMNELRALDGKIMISITRQGEDPRREEAYYKNLQTNVCKSYCFRNNGGAPEATDFCKMLMRNAMALRWAKTLSLWNGRDVKAHGGSMGGYQALGLAALDPQVSEVCADIPWCADFAGASKFRRMGGWAPGWSKALDYVALAHLATRVKCPVSMTIGLGDYVCPPSGEILLFNNLKGEKTLCAKQNMGHGSLYGPDVPAYVFRQKIAGEAAPAVARGMRYAKWHNDYKDAVVYKIFMKAKDEPAMATNLADAMDIVRRIEKWTGGMHQIAYLVGWQFEGHDSKYPSWSEVGRQVAYPGTDTPLAALRQAMRDARRHNTDLSLHINMNDAYTNAPDWQAYLEAGAICRAKDGQPAKYQVFCGEQSYQVNHIREWEAGLAQRRIRAIIEMIPELRDAKTIHIDAFFGTQDEFLGTSYKDDEKAIDKCIDLWHELGIDVTTELLFDMDHIGFFPTVYHNNMDERHRLQVRPEVMCGGDQEWSCRDMNWYCFGETWHARAPDGGVVYPEAWGESHWGDLARSSMQDGKKFLRGLFTHTLLCRWYNRHAPVRHEVDAVHYKVHRRGGVLCDVRIADRRLTVTQNGRVVAEGGDMLLDFAEPDGAKLIAYSKAGCDRTFELPEAMGGVKRFAGLRLPSEQPVELTPVEGKIRVTLSAGEGFCVQEAESR